MKSKKRRNRKLREDFFKRFIKLSCEEKINWALNSAYNWCALLPKRERSIIEYFRNGKKNIKII
jgi:DNA-binding NarL/FixJ family response regulator